MNVAETNGIDDAIAAVGSQAALAEIIGCVQQNVSAWKSQGFVPVEHVVAVEQASGVPRTRLIKPALMELITPPSM
jgi:DNA-binding transcriptional regulator YdaS (Cro superfamily)